LRRCSLLTVEEILARGNSEDRQFMEQAAGIVVNEVETLERRVRAFSEFSSEPSMNPEKLDVNPLIEERVAFLGSGYRDVTYEMTLNEGRPIAWADADQTRGILTNLLENAAEAAGPSGTVCTASGRDDDSVFVEVHDSGPGLSAEARASLFQPTITFKKKGMGLGLSIARKSALLAGGDIILIDGQLGGAGFRVSLPAAP
jgi:nitrogen fixation/metabolism regulation signal transduction histidine kinase